MRYDTLNQQSQKWVFDNSSFFIYLQVVSKNNPMVNIWKNGEKIIIYFSHLKEG